MQLHLLQQFLHLVQMNDVKIEDLNYDNLEAVAHLKGSTRYQDIMQVSPGSIPQCFAWTFSRAAQRLWC